MTPATVDGATSTYPIPVLNRMYMRNTSPADSESSGVSSGSGSYEAASYGSSPSPLKKGIGANRAAVAASTDDGENALIEFMVRVSLAFSIEFMVRFSLSSWYVSH